MNIEKQKLLVSYLLTSSDLFWKVNGIVESDYFDPQLKNSVKFIKKYYEDFKIAPTKEQILVETQIKLEPAPEITKQEIKYAEKELESFCRNKAIESAILASPKLLLDQNFGAIEKLIKAAIQVGLQKDLGLDYFDDPEARLRSMTLNNNMMSTRFIELDEALGGGINRKEMLIILAGCVHPDTKIKIRYKKKLNNWIEIEVKISEVKNLLDTNHEIEVDSPDGWVKINTFIDKGIHEEYVLTLEDNNIVRVNGNHLFETTDGWKLTKTLYQSKSKHFYLTKTGYQSGIITKSGNSIPIVDINVEHENNRYFSNGVSSHNSGVGKSLVMANLAKNLVEQQYNVLYITLELSEDVVGKRFDSMMSGYSQTDILKNITKVSSDVKSKGSKSGKLFIKYMPPSTTNANHIRAYLKEFETIHGFLPDAICVDYLDLMASIEKISVENVSIKDKYVSEELRSIGNDYDAAIISASQLNRTGAASDAADLSQGGIAGGFTKIFTADNVLAVQQTDLMKAAKEYLFKLLKTRSSNGVGKIFMMNVDPTTLIVSNKDGVSSSLTFVQKNKDQAPVVPKPKEKPINNLLTHFNV